MIIIRWPDGTECEPQDLHQYNHMSDDFLRVEVPDDYELGSGVERPRSLGGSEGALNLNDKPNSSIES